MLFQHTNEEFYSPYPQSQQAAELERELQEMKAQLDAKPVECQHDDAALVEAHRDLQIAENERNDAKNKAKTAEDKIASLQSALDDSKQQHQESAHFLNKLTRERDALETDVKVSRDHLAELERIYTCLQEASRASDASTHKLKMEYENLKRSRDQDLATVRFELETSLQEQERTQNQCQNLQVRYFQNDC